MTHLRGILSERLAKVLAARIPDAFCVALHGGLEKEEQDVAFKPANKAIYKRKIVIATNIAEASPSVVFNVATKFL